MEHLHKAYEMLDRELETIVNQGGDLNAQTLDQIDELTHAMKNVQTVIAMHEAEHGNSGRMYYDDGTYGRGGSYGRSYDDWGMRNGRDGYRNGYSGNRGGRMR